MLYQAIFMVVQWKVFHRKEYLYYILYIVAMSVFFIFRLDRGLHFLPLHPSNILDEYLDQPLVIFAFWMYIRFGLFFLQLKEEQPQVYKATINLEKFFMGFVIFKCIIIPFGIPRLISSYIYLGAVLMLTILAMKLIVRLLRQKNLLNNFLVLGGLCITLGGVTGPIVALFLPNMGDGKIVVHMGLEVGVLIELLLLNTGLVIKNKLIQQEVINTQQNLITQLQQTSKLKSNLSNLQQKISNDLHDDIGASLSSIQLYVEVIEKVFDKDPVKAKNLLELVKDYARDTSGNMGDIVWALNTTKVENISFEQKLKNYCYDLLSPKDISCFVEIPEWFGKKVTNIDVLRNLMMVTKECLNNIAKYSKASHCEVAAILTDSELLVRITDDGVGFDIAKSLTGNGLRNMRQRIENLGGRFFIKTENGDGTSIGIAIPIARI